MQGRAMSFVEAAANVVVGVVVAFGTQVLAFPVLGVTATLSQNAALSGLFTVVSLARSYALRRFFAALER